VAAIFRFSIGERTQTAEPSSSIGRHSFIALQDGVLQRTSSILQLFCNEPLLLAYLSVM